MIDPEKDLPEGVRPRILLHICCAPCSSATLERLQDRFDVDFYFYNPNIEPFEEFSKRAGEARRFVREFREDRRRLIRGFR